MAYENTSGLGTIKSYGPYTESPFDTSVVVFGLTKQVIFPLTGGEAFLSGFDQDDTAQVEVIPANSYITMAKVFVETAFTAATVTIGTETDADGFFTTAADLATASDWEDGDGALVGATIASATRVTATTSADTVGSGLLVIEYMVVPTV